MSVRSIGPALLSSWSLHSWTYVVSSVYLRRKVVKGGTEGDGDGPRRTDTSLAAGQGAHGPGQVQRSGRVAGASEAVEDQVEPERELVAIVVAGLEDVLDGELGEVGVLVGGDLRHHHLRHLDRLLLGVA